MALASPARVLLKISGESLASDDATGLDFATARKKWRSKL